MKTLATIFKIKKGKKIVNNTKKGYTAVCTFKPSKQIKWHDEIETGITSPKPKHIQGDHTNHHLVLDTIIKEKQKRSKEERYKDKETRYRINCNRFEQLFLRLKKQGNGELILNNQQLHAVEEFFIYLKTHRKKLSAKKKLLIGLYKTFVLNNCLIKKSEKERLNYEKFHDKKTDKFWKNRDKWDTDLLTKSPISKSDRIEQIAIRKEEEKCLREKLKKRIAEVNKKNTIHPLTREEYIKTKENIRIKKWTNMMFSEVEKLVNKMPNLTEDQINAKKKAERKIIEKQAIEEKDKILDSLPEKKQKTKKIKNEPSVDYLITSFGTSLKKMKGYDEPQSCATILEMRTATDKESATKTAQEMTNLYHVKYGFKESAIHFLKTDITKRYSSYIDLLTGITVNKPNEQLSSNICATKENGEFKVA